MEGFSVAQIAPVTTELAGSLRFYSEVFGYQPAGSRALWGSVMAIQKLPPETRALLWWLWGGQKFVQLELFQYSNPVPHRLPEDWLPSDHGWTRFGIEVDDYDATRSKLAGWKVTPLGPEGRTVDGQRCVAFRDPFVGCVIELAEKSEARKRDFPPGPFIFYVALSVADLDSSRKFFGDTLAFTLSAREVVHRPQHEELWGLEGAEVQGFVAQTGQVLVEVVSYKNGRPRAPHLRICDQGIMNVALGTAAIANARMLVKRMAAEGIHVAHAHDADPIYAAYFIQTARELEILAVPEALQPVSGFGKVGQFPTG
jgi:catechol 2,3-dioxygenase-like lactoylglutathione lyase family enzyme